MKIKVVLLAILVLFTCSCGVKDLSKGEIENVKYEETSEITNYVKIEMNNNDVILIELYLNIAPITVENFQKLVNEKYYDGLIFHRVIKDFMVQTGDPTGTGAGGSEETITGEFSANGIENNLSHDRGIISMARKGSDPETEYTLNSASSQFFIMHADYPYLDGNYAAFGKVIAGMSAVDKIATTAVNNNNKPIKEQKIRSIRFVTIEK